MRDDAGEAAGEQGMDVTSGAAGDRSEDGSVWLTYAELAARLGISAASAKRRANRRRWAKRLNNSGLSTVAVPREVLEAGPHRLQDGAGDNPGATAGDDPSDDNALAEHLKGELQEARTALQALRADLRVASSLGQTIPSRRASAFGTAGGEGCSRTPALLSTSTRASGYGWPSDREAVRNGHVG